jgi:polar amino acid transport system substrate-binding protein
MLTAVLLITGCSTVTDRVHGRHGPLLVGVTPDYPPVIFKKGDDIVGLEADMAHLLSGELGRPLRFVELKWEQQIPALLDGRVDIIMSGMSITKSRRIRTRFTDPYLKVGLAALTRRKELDTYPGTESVLKSDARIGVEKGTTGDVFVQQHCANARRTAYLHPADAALDVQRKRIDVFIHDAPAIHWLASEYEADLVVVPGTFSEEYLAWAVRRNDQALEQTVNDILQEWKKDGTLRRLVQRWLPTLTE